MLGVVGPHAFRTLWLPGFQNSSRVRFSGTYLQDLELEHKRLLVVKVKADAGPWS